MEALVRISRLCVIILACAGLTSAGTVGNVEFLGFSPDGAYAAMLEHWVSDGSGCPAARLTVMSAETDSTVFEMEWWWPEYRMEELESEGAYWLFPENPARDSVLLLSAAVLDSLALNDGLQGTHCIHHPLLDRGVKDDRATFVTWMGTPGWMGPGLTLDLVEHRHTPEDAPEWLGMFEEPVLLELTITDQTGAILYQHTDSEEDGLFRFASDYRIRDVYVLGDSVAAIVLNTLEPGFEGPDGKFRLLVGRV